MDDIDYNDDAFNYNFISNLNLLLKNSFFKSF